MNAERSQKYELWRPVIAPQRRRKFDGLYQDVAAAWRRLTADEAASALDFHSSGVSFETFAQLQEAEPGAAQIVGFCVGHPDCAGFMLVSRKVARLLVDMRLGAVPALSDKAEGHFTAIEAAIAEELVREFFRRLVDLFGAAGLVECRPTFIYRGLAELNEFAADDSLLVCRFTVQNQPDSGHIMVALEAKAGDMLNEFHAVPHHQTSGNTVRRISQLPIDAEIVVGNWEMTISEMLRLRAGASLELPPPDEGWLMVSGAPLMPLELNLRGNVITARALRGAKHDGKT